MVCLQCFDAVGWTAGRASGLQKADWWDAGVVICLERGADLHTAQLMPLPLTVTCFSALEVFLNDMRYINPRFTYLLTYFSKIQTGFAFLVPTYLGSQGKRAVKRVCVCVLLWCWFSTRSILLTFILIISSPPDSFMPGLKPSFSANPSHHRRPFLLPD